MSRKKFKKIFEKVIDISQYVRYYNFTISVGGEMIRAVRIRNNLTKNEMAKLLGFSESYYEKIEKGERKPSREFLYQLKKNFPKIDMNIFFT